MGLSNTQYDAIMRRYSLRQSDSRHNLEEHRRIAYEKIPRLAQLDRIAASRSLEQARLLLDGKEGDLYLLRRELAQCTQERRALLAEHGLPEDYLEIQYICDDCRDTGYIGNKKCHCFRREAIDLFYTQSGMKEILEQENFQHFSYEFYPEDMIHPQTGQSSRAMMQETVAACLQFVDEFDHRFSNLFFYGGTGLGKTFLSHCIAKELIEREHSVMYYSAFSLFELFAQDAFSKSESTDAGREYLFDCDLLIIDDLGTELTNAFVTSRLFLLLNERIQREKSTIISTNMPLSTFAEVYSERVFSRISSSFRLLYLFGNDIRIRKKLQG